MTRARLTAALLFVLALFAGHPVFAQVSAPMPRPASARLSQQELELVGTAVRNVGSAYRGQRTSQGVGAIVGGLLVGGLGMYLTLSQEDEATKLIGIGIAFSAVPQLVSGMWNIFYHTSQEDMADKLLADPELLQGGGLLFVEQEARAARRHRLVGGSTMLVQGAATLGTYFLIREYFVTGPNNILLIFFSAAAGLQVLQGIILLASKSGAEKAYRDLLISLGRDPTQSPSRDANSVSRLRVVPAAFGDERGRLAPGLGLTLGF